MFKRIVGVLFSTVLFVMLLTGIALAQDPDIVIDKTISDTRETADGCVSTITITVEAVGDASVAAAPVDTMLVIDNSGSMDGQKLKDAQTAASDFVDNMNLGADQVGVAQFASSASVVQQLTVDGNAAKNAINSLSSGITTNMGGGINAAQAELQSSHHKPGNLPVIALLSDGHANAGVDPVVAAAAAKSAGTHIITIGLGSGADETTLKSVASTPNDYHYAPTSAELNGIYQSIGTTLNTLAASNVVVQEVLSSLANYVPGTFSVDPTSISDADKKLTWNIGLMTVGQTWVVSFDILQEDVGLTSVVDESKVSYTNSKGQQSEKISPKTECLGCEGLAVTPGLESGDLSADVASVNLSAGTLPDTGANMAVFGLIGVALITIGCTSLMLRKRFN